MSKLMDFINERVIEAELSDNEKKEKKQTRKKLKAAKTNLKEMTVDRDLYREKYISLLEEKGEGFNQYLFWQNKANETEAEEKELRKELSDLKKEQKEYDEVLGKLFSRGIVSALSKCENFDDFIIYLLNLHYTDKDLPMKSIKSTCSKLEITKNMIKKESEYLYRILNVDKWEID